MAGERCAIVFRSSEYFAGGGDKAMVSDGVTMREIACEETLREFTGIDRELSTEEDGGAYLSMQRAK